MLICIAKRMLLLTFLLAKLLSVAIGGAPGDGDVYCTRANISFLRDEVLLPSNMKILMDSFSYISLLPPMDSVGPRGVWQQLDPDDNEAGNEVSIYNIYG